MATRRSNRRQTQAAATRHDILAAARRLFASHGYVATSMAAIAEEADTAVQTIYASVGPKRAIVLALVDAIDEEAGVGAVRQRLGQSRDPRELVALAVGLTRNFAERCGDVFGVLAAAASTEPDVAEAWQTANRRHRGGVRMVAHKLAELGALKPGVSADRAGDILAVLTWTSTWQQLTQDHGWSFDECERWLTDSLATLLMRDDA